MKGNRFKQDNRGASLLAVLVLMVVVSLIAVVITKITIVNIEMKEVERGTKKNFYSADELMDNLRAGARELAEQSLEKAYADVLENYLTYSASGGDVQKVFATRYMDGLQKQFAENHTDPAVGASDTMDASGNVAYRVSGYDTDTVKSCIKEAADQGCYIPATDPKYEVDYGAGTFTLKGVQIRYKDAQDYETTIKTDLVFSTPKMNFSGRGQVQEFMRYALIADRQINIGAQNVTVDGSVYAGADGIYASTGGNGTIKGKTVLTRGDIVTESGSDLTVGDGGSSIWAENIKTSSAGTNGASSIHMNGNMYVADDLELAGRGSSVTLQGNYYGYNFQKNYGAQDPDSAKKAEFSSAMMVNGKSSHLDIKGLNYLLLAGRTFISRKLDASNEDILMGESISARTNQLAYYVPLEYVSGDGKSLDQYLTEQGRENETIHIVLLEGTEGATAAIGRTNGILHGVEEHPNWTIVDRGCANFTQGEGQTYMENLLSKGTVKDIDVIISENDNMIFGAMKALDRNGKSYGPEGDIIMISFDALHESFENMMAGKLHATVECNPLLASTVEAVIEELEAGREVDKIYNTEENIYTYENAADYIDQRKY